MRTLTLAAALLLAACRTATPGVSTAVGASTMTAAAIGAAAASRAAGGCIAVCTNGTICNTNSGLCERAPCEGRCGPGERCESTFTGNQCVSTPTTGVVTNANATKSPAAVVPVTEPPDTNHASPTIVPTAEKAPPKN
jgi:hypothetical protein